MGGPHATHRHRRRATTSRSPGTNKPRNVFSAQGVAVMEGINGIVTRRHAVDARRRSSTSRWTRPTARSRAPQRDRRSAASRPRTSCGTSWRPRASAVSSNWAGAILAPDGGGHRSPTGHSDGSIAAHDVTINERRLRRTIPSAAACRRRRSRRSRRETSRSSRCAPIRLTHAPRAAPAQRGRDRVPRPLEGHRLRPERRPDRPGQVGHVLRHPGRRRGPSHRRHVGLDDGRGDDRHATGAAAPSSSARP